MIEERRKAELISHELLRYFFNHQIEKMEMSINFTKKGTTVAVVGIISEPPKDLAEFTSLLNVDRDEDLEMYSQGLVGTHHESEDFALLGLMTDDADVTFSNQRLEITLYRAYL